MWGYFQILLCDLSPHSILEYLMLLVVFFPLVFARKIKQSTNERHSRSRESNKTISKIHRKRSTNGPEKTTVLTLAQQFYTHHGKLRRKSVDDGP